MSPADRETPAFWVGDTAVDEAQFQRVALDPRHSVAIQACAGSGKTWLLVARIVRLLLAGADPSEILAITFTRKAAEEMRRRVAEELRKLALEDDEKVLERLGARGLERAEAEVLQARARGLLERVLDDAQPITIDTFHGWFAQIVRNAPMAAGVPQGFTIAENTARLRKDAWRRFVAGLRRDTGLRAAYLDLLDRSAERSARDLLMRLISRRNDWNAYLDGRDLEEALVELERDLGVSATTDPRATLMGDAGFQARLTEYLSVLCEGTPTEAERARRAEQALAKTAQRFDPQGFAEVANLVRVATDGGVRAPTQVARSSAHRLRGADGPTWLQAHGAQLHADLVAAEAAGLEFENLMLNRAAWSCAQALIGHYQALKRENGALDFDDLEDLAARLSRDPVSGAYIQARLDVRYRHILVDEFQDTNPLQWLTLRSWLEAYGNEGDAPSVFLVGDPTQSIYRFRRADPRLFGEAERFLVERFGARRLRTTQTRRCSQAVVDLVNSVLVVGNSRLKAHRTVNPAIGATLRLPLVEPRHESAVAIDGGAIVLRDVLLDAAPEPANWQHQDEARAIAAFLRQLIDQGRLETFEPHQPAQGPVHYRDVMILVRQRKSIEDIERALRSAAIPYSSDRRGGLLQTLEVADLCALLKFLVVPFSGLHLAHVLRSPLFGFADSDLLELAGPAQDEATWWQRLRARPDRSHFVGAGSRLERWIALAGVLPVHDLLDRIYHEGAVIERYTASVPNDAPLALTDQVRSNLLAFLELALELDSGRYPSLPRFIDELEELGEARDDESPDEGITDFGDTVRILTIHGAKGLEAPIVLLTDTGITARRAEHHDVLVHWSAGADAPRHVSVFGTKSSRGAARAQFFAEEERLAQEEDWNLLYVAATRAQDVLVLSGMSGARGSAADSWYARCAPSVQAFEAALSWPAEIEARVAGASFEIRDFRPARQPVGTRRAPPGESSAGDELARRRGIALHRVLELLPGGALTRERADAIAASSGVDPENAARIGATAVAMLRAPSLKRFFDATLYRNAANEVEFVDATGELVRIDRLVEFDEELWVLDYKSQASSADPSAHRPQLERYMAILRELHPETEVKGAVVFADGVLAEF